MRKRRPPDFFFLTLWRTHSEKFRRTSLYESERYWKFDGVCRSLNFLRKNVVNIINSFYEIYDHIRHWYNVLFILLKLK